MPPEFLTLSQVIPTSIPTPIQISKLHFLLLPGRVFQVVFSWALIDRQLAVQQQTKVDFVRFIFTGVDI